MGARAPVRPATPPPADDGEAVTEIDVVPPDEVAAPPAGRRDTTFRPAPVPQSRQSDTATAAEIRRRGSGTQPR
jgi:hypothetical protein